VSQYDVVRHIFASAPDYHTDVISYCLVKYLSYFNRLVGGHRVSLTPVTGNVDNGKNWSLVSLTSNEKHQQYDHAISL